MTFAPLGDSEFGAINRGATQRKQTILGGVVLCGHFIKSPNWSWYPIDDPLHCHPQSSNRGSSSCLMKQNHSFTIKPAADSYCPEILVPLIP